MPQKKKRTGQYSWWTQTKNSQQNVNKSNLAIHLKDHMSWSSGIIPEMQGSLKSTNLSVWYTTLMKWKIKTIWLSQPIGESILQNTTYIYGKNS